MQPDYRRPYTPAALPSGETYTVQAGDNLSQIAAGYGVSVGQMLQANGIQNPNIIYVGQAASHSVTVRVD